MKYRQKLLIGSLLFLAVYGGCRSLPKEHSDVKTQQTLLFLALGDSYTIGERVAERDRWPDQLARGLREAHIPVGDPHLIARTGWTTDELSAAIATQGEIGTFGLVSLQIGVNNQYRGRTPEEYRQQFAELLTRAIRLAGGEKTHVFVVSTPDWGSTPFARNEGRDAKVVAGDIDGFNAVARDESIKHGVLFVDVTPISREVTVDPNLLAGDGLHPSGKMYTRWTKERILPAVLGLLHRQ
jgi:lysophospholipase L1-like esterase